MGLKLKAVFFDMDGVLYDSMKNHASAWVKAMHEAGLPFTENDAYLNEGRTGDSTIDSVFEPLYGKKATQAEKENIYRLKTKYFDQNGKVNRMPYALDLIQKIKLQGIDVYLVTGSGQASLLDFLEADFPQVFNPEKMVTAFDVKYGKPHPEPYLMALKKSGYKTDEVMVVENAPLGLESATSAGLFAVGVNTGTLSDEVLIKSGAKVLYSDMKELYESWDSLKNFFEQKTA